MSEFKMKNTIDEGKICSGNINLPSGYQYIIFTCILQK